MHTNCYLQTLLPVHTYVRMYIQLGLHFTCADRVAWTQQQHVQSAHFPNHLVLQVCKRICSRKEYTKAIDKSDNIQQKSKTANNLNDIHVYIYSKCKHSSTTSGGIFWNTICFTKHSY